MFITAEEVMRVTPYENVTNAHVQQAQFIIEAFTGRTESQIDSPKDKAMMARAVAFQAIYMMDNPDVTFNQVKATMISSGGQMTTFSDDYSPFIAPLAAKTCNHLSWKQSRSVKVGALNQRRGLNPLRRWATE